jgi:hypothetical protein
MRNVSVDKTKKWLEAIQAAVTIVAIAIGGSWTAWVYIIQREIAPHAVVEVKGNVVRLSDDVNLVQVNLKVQNTGHRLIPTASATAWIQDVLPLYGCSPNLPCATHELNAALNSPDRVSDKFDWPLLSIRNSSTLSPIEPGETVSLQFEFAIPGFVKVARLYGFVENTYLSKGQDPKSGWLDSQFIVIDSAAKSLEASK